jgi:hypothetical protein
MPPVQTKSINIPVPVNLAIVDTTVLLVCSWLFILLLPFSFRRNIETRNHRYWCYFIFVTYLNFYRNMLSPLESISKCATAYKNMWLSLWFIFPFYHCLYYVVISLVSIHVCYTYRTTMDPLDIEPILIFLIGVKCVEQATYWSHD